MTQPPVEKEERKLRDEERCHQIMDQCLKIWSERSSKSDSDKTYKPLFTQAQYAEYQDKMVKMAEYRERIERRRKEHEER